MAGRVISRANAAHIQEIYERAKKLGARELDATAKADSLLEHVEAVRRAAYRLTLEDGRTPYVEDILDGGLVILELGDQCYRAEYATAADGTVTIAARDAWQLVEQVWQPVNDLIKAAGLPDPGAGATWASVKALGDRVLELRVAWGRDGHGEQFTPATDFDLEHFPAPPVAYYHGFTTDGRPAARPIYIGKTIARANRADGHVLTAKLNDKPEAEKVWAAALAGRAFVSPGTVSHLRRKAADGSLTYWPIAEISAWDGAPTRKQAHPASLAFPVLKALYAEAGLALPAPLHETPEAAGDAAGAVPSLDPDAVGRVIAAEVATTLMHLRKGQP